MDIITRSEEETAIFAQKIAKTLQKNDVLCLYGDLGAGKTVFSREIIRFLTQNIEKEVPSPTFTLVQAYESPDFPIFHYDLYRLEDPEDLYELGWEDSLSDGLCIVEWPERAANLIPALHKAVYIHSVPGEPSMRKIRVEDQS